MKKLALVALALLCAHEATAHRGWGGGFATGALIGTGITLAATRGGRERSPEYYESKERSRQRSEIRRQIKEYKREIRNHERSIKKLQKKISRLQSKGSYSNHEITYHKQAIKEHKNTIKEHRSFIDELKEELRNIF